MVNTRAAKTTAATKSKAKKGANATEPKKSSATDVVPPPVTTATSSKVKSSIMTEAKKVVKKEKGVKDTILEEKKASVTAKTAPAPKSKGKSSDSSAKSVDTTNVVAGLSVSGEKEVVIGGESFSMKELMERMRQQILLEQKQKGAGVGVSSIPEEVEKEKGDEVDVAEEQEQASDESEHGEEAAEEAVVPSEQEEEGDIGEKDAVVQDEPEEEGDGTEEHEKVSVEEETQDDKSKESEAEDVIEEEVEVNDASSESVPANTEAEGTVKTSETPDLFQKSAEKVKSSDEKPEEGTPSVPEDVQLAEDKSVPEESPVKSVPSSKMKSRVKHVASKNRKRAKEISEDLRESKRTKSEGNSSGVKGASKGGVWFRSQKNAVLWESVQNRVIVHEKVVKRNKYPAAVYELLEETGLIGTVQKAGKFSEQLVREVIVNLPTDFGDKESKKYGNLRVRGRLVNIFPEAICEYYESSKRKSEAVTEDYDVIVEELTCGLKKTWTGSSFKASELSTKYSFLFQAAHFNWIPTTHKATVNKEMGKLLYAIGKKKVVNIGELVFEHLSNHAGSDRDQQPIGFPSLIHELVLEQFPDILTPADILSGEPKVLADDKKMYDGNRVNDLAKGKGVPAAVSVTIPLLLHKRILKDLRGQIACINGMVKKLSGQRAHLRELLMDAERYVAEDVPTEEAELDSDEE